MTRVPAQVIAYARQIRSALEKRSDIDTNLAGACALASMMLAAAIGDADVFRVGFFMRRENFCGHRSRYPNTHAWCRIGPAIVDVTATQFGRFPAIYIVGVDATDRYVECANGMHVCKP